MRLSKRQWGLNIKTTFLYCKLYITIYIVTAYDINKLFIHYNSYQCIIPFVIIPYVKIIYLIHLLNFIYKYYNLVYCETCIYYRRKTSLPNEKDFNSLSAIM